MEQRVVRVQYAVFPSREAAIQAGFLDAEFGTWQPYAGSSKLVEGWIALEVEEEQ